MVKMTRMPFNKREQIYRSAIVTFGEAAQFVKLREELSELQLAMARFELGREGIESVIEEVADAIIMLDQARMILGRDLVNVVIEQKLDRLVTTISSAQSDRSPNWPVEKD